MSELNVEGDWTFPDYSTGDLGPFSHQGRQNDDNSRSPQNYLDAPSTLTQSLSCADDSGIETQYSSSQRRLARHNEESPALPTNRHLLVSDSLLHGVANPRQHDDFSNRSGYTQSHDLAPTEPQQYRLVRESPFIKLPIPPEPGLWVIDYDGTSRPEGFQWKGRLNSSAPVLAPPQTHQNVGNDHRASYMGDVGGRQASMIENPGYRTPYPPLSSLSPAIPVLPPADVGGGLSNNHVHQHLMQGLGSGAVFQSNNTAPSEGSDNDIAPPTRARNPNRSEATLKKRYEIGLIQVWITRADLARIRCRSEEQLRACWSTRDDQGQKINQPADYRANVRVTRTEYENLIRLRAIQGGRPPASRNYAKVLAGDVAETQRMAFSEDHHNQVMVKDILKFHHRTQPGSLPDRNALLLEITNHRVR